MAKDILMGLARRLLPPGVRANLRRSRFVNRYLKFRYGGVRSVQHPLAPFTLYYDGFRNLGLSAHQSGEVHCERDEMTFVADWMKQSRVNCAWDVGANIGSWMLFLAGLKPLIRQIICFEPDAANRQMLEMNVSKNHIDRVRIVTSALSSQTGSATFQADPFTGSTGTLESGPTFISKWYGQKSEMVSIPVTTADELVSQGTAPPDFVKIDVEGHELSVLEGATETLRQHRPMLMMEVTANAEAVGRLLADLSYELVDPANGQKLSRPQAATAAIPK